MKTATVLVGVAAALLNLSSTSACTASDGKKIADWMSSCDSVVGGSQAKCDSKTCHTALHRLIEDDTVECYVQLGLGPSSALSKYKPLDAFCHGEGPDPAAPGPAPTSPPAPTQAPTQTPTQPPGPDPRPTTTQPAPGPTPTSASTPSPSSETKATEKPSGESGSTTNGPAATTATPVDATTTTNTTDIESVETKEEGSNAASGTGGTQEETVEINPASTPAPVATIPASAASTTAVFTLTMVAVGGITAAQLC